MHRHFPTERHLFAFITCGDPDLETTAEAVSAVKAGADLIELGIPFSDPTAEGPVIQAASIRALKGGVTTDKIFDFVRGLREEVTVPMAFMTYANVVFSYGSERFISTCSEIGIDGLILPNEMIAAKYASTVGRTYHLPAVTISYDPCCVFEKLCRV